MIVGDHAGVDGCWISSLVGGHHHLRSNPFQECGTVEQGASANLEIRDAATTGELVDGRPRHAQELGHLMRSQKHPVDGLVDGFRGDVAGLRPRGGIRESKLHTSHRRRPPPPRGLLKLRPLRTLTAHIF